VWRGCEERKEVWRLVKGEKRHERVEWWGCVSLARGGGEQREEKRQRGGERERRRRRS